MDEKVRLGLHENYALWTMSQRILARAHDTSGIAIGRLEAALENTIMGQLLALDGASAREVFDSVGEVEIARGQRVVGIEAPESVASIAAIFAEERAATHAHPDAEVELDGEVLGYHGFRSDASPALTRLLDHARAIHGDALGEAYVCSAAMRYRALYARTRHIGPPQRVYDLFHDWGVRNEGFASPFNARLLGKRDARFFSAFADTDTPFGSGGTFFQADHASFEGAWCVDPPFLFETMRRTDRAIQALRAREDAPCVLMIVPTSYALELEPDEHVRLREGVHFYEGLDGALATLPVDVSIYRFGQMDGFDAAAIEAGYLPANMAASA